MGTVSFNVSATLPPGQILGVVGSAAEIGGWNYKEAKFLDFDNGSPKWRKQIKFHSPGKVEYCYFSGIYTLNEDGSKNIIVREWEAGVTSNRRCIEIKNGEEIMKDDGEFGSLNMNKILDRGWLCGQTEIRINISDAGEKPIVSWCKGQLAVPENLRIKFEMDDSVFGNEVRSIKPYKYVNLKPHEFTNLPNKEHEVLTFSFEVMNLREFCGAFVFSDSNGVILGRATVMGDQLGKSIDKISVAIVDGNASGIGSLNLEYVVIKTYENDLMDMSKSFATHWKKRPTLNIGHRGAGNSFTAATPSDIFENTLEGFKAAAAHGAAMVEFDVQLTKNNIPVVFHDFTICTSVASKTNKTKLMLHEVEVQALTYQEALDFSTRHRFRKSSSRVPDFDEDDPDLDRRPFPTLQEVFEQVPEHCGFDVELKWPHYNMEKTWYHGVKSFPDANFFLDTILDVVYKHAGTRRIIFSCFEANICTMLRRKQNRYPVVFLASEGDKFMELRSRFNSLAVPFSASEKFIGYCTEDNSAYKDPELVKRVHDAGLLFFLYGDDIVNPGNRELLTEQGADGIIYDRIHHILPEGSSVFQKHTL